MFLLLDIEVYTCLKFRVLPRKITILNFKFWTYKAPKVKYVTMRTDLLSYIVLVSSEHSSGIFKRKINLKISILELYIVYDIGFEPVCQLSV